jgi:ribosome modulation factor
MVGADESAEPGLKRIGPDKNDPYEQGWRAGHRRGQDKTVCPYQSGTPEHAQWIDGYEEAQAQPDHYNEGRAGVDDTDTIGFSVNTEAAYTAVMKHFNDVIEYDETSGVMYAPARVWPQIEMVAFDADGEGAMRDEGIEEEQLDEKCWDGYEKKGMKTMFGKRVPNCVKNEGAERNEMDTPAVQAALAKMAERHKGEKWSKEQLAALGKRIAARGQKPVKEGDIIKTPTGLIHKGKYGTSYYDPKNKNEPGTNKVGRPVKSTGRDVSIDEPRQIRRNQPGYMEKTPRITNPDAPRSPVRKTGPIAGGGLDIDLPKHVQDRIFAQSEFDRFKSNPGIVRVKSKDDGVAILDLDETSQEMVKEAVTKEDIISKLKARLGDYLSDISKEIKKDPDLVDKLAAKSPGDQMGPPVKTITTDDGHEIQIHGNEDDGFRISIKNKQSASKFKNLDEAVMACEMYCAQRRKQTESADYIDEAGKDACYHKVKSRYKIWPSAYASGALVRCRKVGADNWGNKSKK